MEQYIPKSTVVAEINRRIEKCDIFYIVADNNNAKDVMEEIKREIQHYKSLLDFLNTIEVTDPYEQCIQYPSIKDSIKAHAETYSFNIESELFNQLTKEQQELWRKEIEQACISGGDAGVKLARDIRYKENLEMKGVDIRNEVSNWWNNHYTGIKKDYTFEGYSGHYLNNSTIVNLAQYFYELGLKTQNENKL